MNRGVLQTSSPVQQIMAAGNPNWWNINNMRSPSLHQQSNNSPSLSPPNLFPHHYTPSDDNQEQLPESWSQLLLSGLVEEDKASMANFQASSPSLDAVKQENSASSYAYASGKEAFQTTKPSWSRHHHQMIPPVSSPNSCVTTFSSNLLDFSSNKGDPRHPPPDRSSECNSSGSGGALKKARVQASSTQSTTFKVRKEKLGDRVTTLHQLVSPFGKIDTASVLLEAIGYIRFLQSQIEALSLPYLGSGSSNIRHQQSVQGERNCIFPEDPAQDFNEFNEEPKKDLRSRGLCLVPVSCTLQVGSDNGADY